MRNIINHLSLDRTGASLYCSDDEVLRVPRWLALSLDKLEASVFVPSDGVGDLGDRCEQMVLGPHGVDEVLEPNETKHIATQRRTVPKLARHCVLDVVNILAYYAHVEEAVCCR